VDRVKHIIEFPRPVLELETQEFHTETWASEWRVTIVCGGVELFVQMFSTENEHIDVKYANSQEDAEDQALKQFGEKMREFLK
jgi:hypothetical protein